MRQQPLTFILGNGFPCNALTTRGWRSQVSQRKRQEDLGGSRRSAAEPLKDLISMRRHLHWWMAIRGREAEQCGFEEGEVPGDRRGDLSDSLFKDTGSRAVEIPIIDEEIVSNDSIDMDYDISCAHKSNGLGDEIGDIKGFSVMDFPQEGFNKV